MASGIKYALLLLPTHFDEESGARDLPRGMISWRGKLSDVLDPDDVRQWREWMGTIEWAKCEKEVRFVLAGMSSDTAEVIDGESNALVDRVTLAWHAMLLAAPIRAFYGRARCLHGEALSIARGSVRLKTIRGYQRMDKIQRSFYMTRQAFVKVLPWRQPDPYLDRWADRLALLDAALAKGLPRILSVAFTAFQVALTRDSLEFAIPEFVRTVECIVGLQRGKGRKEFAVRAMCLAPVLHSHWYVGGDDLQARIEELFQHRSDCVHGKVPLDTLLSSGTLGEDEAARFGYLAEALARECLLWVLNRPQHLQYFADRPTLEDAWAKNLLPQLLAGAGFR